MSYKQRDITLTQNSNSKEGLDPKPPMQGQDALDESQEIEVCQNGGFISFDGDIQPCDTTLDSESSIGLSTDLSMEAIISGVWESSNVLFYNSDILENFNNFS